MTVAELIEKLQECQGESTIKIVRQPNDDFLQWSNVEVTPDEFTGNNIAWIQLLDE